MVWYIVISIIFALLCSWAVWRCWSPNACAMWHRHDDSSDDDDDSYYHNNDAPDDADQDDDSMPEHSPVLIRQYGYDYGGGGNVQEVENGKELSPATTAAMVA